MNLSIRTVAQGILLLLAANLLSAQTQTYCTNNAGNIACTSYDQGSASQSYCTSIAGSLSCTTFGDDNSRVQIQKNYEAGQIIGTALGNAIVAAIDEYKTNKRIRQAKQNEWNQFVQDTLAKTQLACERDPKHAVSVVGCRTAIFTFNQFLHIHKKDFVPDAKNVKMLANAIDKTASDDESSWTEQTYETAFQILDRKQLDKKIYVGQDGDRSVW